MDNGNGQDVPIWWTDLQYEMYMYTCISIIMINNSYYTYKIPLSLGLVVKSGVKRPLSCSQCKFHWHIVTYDKFIQVKEFHQTCMYINACK